MTAEPPRVSVVVPAYDESEHILPVLDRLFESVHLPCEVLIVVDSEDDSTVPVVTEYALKEPRIRCVVDTYGRGPVNAIRFGIDVAAAPVAVVMCPALAWKTSRPQPAATSAPHTANNRDACCSGR